MKLINSKVEYLPQPFGLDGIYYQIERCGRTCYQSQSKGPDKVKDFVDRIIKNHHTAMLEHGTVYLMGRFTSKKALFEDDWAIKYIENPYSKTVRVPLDGNNRYKGPQMLYVTTNYRVIIENYWKKDLKESEDPDAVFSYSPTDFHEKRYTFKFTCSRAIANELVRHRKFSFAQESTRYCNYNKDKFDNQISFIAPEWLVKYHAGVKSNKTTIAANETLALLKKAEDAYHAFIDQGFTPQQARDILPNATKTELCMTGFASDWRYLLDLRLYEKTGKVHPDMLDLMQKFRTVAQEADIWYDIIKYPSKFK